MRENIFFKKTKFYFIVVTLLFLTGCTTTKHILKRTSETVKVYKSSEVLTSYELDKKKSEFTPLITFDADYLVGFAFSQVKKEKTKDKYPIIPLPPGVRPLYIQEMGVNIDLCKHWKSTSFRKRPLEEWAYGKNYSSFTPTDYKLFMSLEKLKEKGLVSNNINEQEDICIYIDREFSGHFGRFKDKSNKVRYKASEINRVRLELENMKD